MEDKLAEDILLLDLRGVCDFTEFFVLATGSSDRMLASLAENTEVKGKAEGLGNPYIEGLPQSGWMVLDYGSVVVHLFSPEKRDYYQLEELWKAGKFILRLKYKKAGSTKFLEPAVFLTQLQV